MALVPSPSARRSKRFRTRHGGHMACHASIPARDEHAPSDPDRKASASDGLAPCLSSRSMPRRIAQIRTSRPAVWVAIGRSAKCLVGDLSKTAPFAVPEAREALYVLGWTPSNSIRPVPPPLAAHNPCDRLRSGNRCFGRAWSAARRLAQGSKSVARRSGRCRRPCSRQ